MSDYETILRGLKAISAETKQGVMTDESTSHVGNAVGSPDARGRSVVAAPWGQRSRPTEG